MLQTVAATPSNRSGAYVAGGSTNGDVFLWKQKVGAAIYCISHCVDLLQDDEGDEEDISSLSMAQKTPASQPVKHIRSFINMNFLQSALLGVLAWLVLIFCFPRGVRAMCHSYDAPLIRKAAP